MKNLITIMGVTLNKDSIAGLGFFVDGMGHRCNNDTTLEEIAKQNSSRHPNSIVDLQFNAEELFNDSTVKDLTNKEANRKEAATPVEFLSKKGIFKAFESAQGVKKLIEIVNTRINGWKHEDRAKKWLQYIQ